MCLHVNFNWRLSITVGTGTCYLGFTFTPSCHCVPLCKIKNLSFLILMVVLFPFSLHIVVPTASIYTSVPLLGRRGRKDLTHSFDYGDDDLDPQWKSPEDTELKDMEEFITLDRQQRQLKHAEEKE